MRRLLMSTAMLLGLLAVGPVAAGEPQLHSHPDHMKLSGTVTKIQSGIVFVKTPVGSLTVNAKTALPNAQVGDHLLMWVNSNNAVIVVYKRGKRGPVHRLISGKLVYASDEKKQIQFSTPEGTKTFQVGPNASNLYAIQEGSPITVEVNEDDTVIQGHQDRVEIVLNLAPEAVKEVRAQVKLSGTVSEIRPGLIFLTTSIGQLSLSNKVGPRGAQVGDEVTMWVNGDKVVIDVHQKGRDASIHRYITGNLTYVSDRKSEVTFWTPEGEKMFRVDQRANTFKGLDEGSPITVELNDAGSIIHVRKAG